jgi:hypothetical protein
MPKAPLIVWEKWLDPLGLEQEDAYVSKFDDDDEDLLEQKDELEEFDHKESIPKHIRVLSTPMGLIPIDHSMSIGKVFNFWVGYTNFNITSNICYLIETTEGVESLDIFTRYRFRIGVGKLFEDGEVMRNINTRVYEFIT